MKLTEFETADHLLLPGLLYEPAVKTKKVTIWLHGNGNSSMVNSPLKMNITGKLLNDNDIAFFPFNNRGAYYLRKLTRTQDGVEDRVEVGTSLELIKDCIQDINGAIEFLEGLGYSEFYLIGHSTGANKACVYNYYQPENKISKFVLSASGDDTGIYYKMLGSKKFSLALKKAQVKIATGLGRKFVSKDILDELMSYQSLYDTINPDGDYNVFPYTEYFGKLNLSTKELFRELKSIAKPTLVIYGAHDEYCYGKVPEIMELLKQETSHPDLFDFQVIPDADHGYHGKEQEMTEAIVNWLAK